VIIYVVFNCYSCNFVIVVVIVYMYLLLWLLFVVVVVVGYNEHVGAA